MEEILARKLELDVIRDEIDSAKVLQLRIGHYGAAVSAVNNGGIHGAVPLPKGALSDEEWGMTLCELAAVASLQLSASQLKDRASGGGTKLRGYLSWLCGAYGPAGTRQLQVHGFGRSQGFDADNAGMFVRKDPLTKLLSENLLEPSRNRRQPSLRQKARQEGDWRWLLWHLGRFGCMWFFGTTCFL